MAEASDAVQQQQQTVMEGNLTVVKTEGETNMDLEQSDVSKEDAQPEGKSSISVIFTDWVPAENLSIDESYTPMFKGAPRYFQVPRGHGKIRPGLGTNPEDLIKAKVKKRKKSPMTRLMEGGGKRFILTPEKPAVAVLNELSSNLEYEFEEIKEDDGKSFSFTCAVTFPPANGAVFIGEGRSKKQAKNAAAERVLESLGVIVRREPEQTSPQQLSHSPPFEFESVNIERMHESAAPFFPSTSLPFPTSVSLNTSDGSGDIDFSSDDIINVNFTTPPTPMLSQPMVDNAILRRLRNIPNFEENICLALNTILSPASQPVYEYLGEEGPPHEKTFTCKLTCNMQEYMGLGGSKKKAKADAAKKAVIAILGESYYNMVVTSSPHIKNPNCVPPVLDCNMTPAGAPKAKKKKRSKGSSVLLPNNTNTQMDEDEDEDDGENDDWGEYDLNFSDHISNMVREQYEEIMGKESPFAPYKVLAGVVMTNGSPMMYNSTVITVTTGTKCIDGDCLSEQGLSVNDCHAEILATRCLRDYLYNQIELYESAKSDTERLLCILEENSTPGTKQKYQLKCDVKFHLYISTSPCGDARIFSPKGIEIEEDQPSPTEMEDTHPNKLNRGVLRSKIEAGEGTIPSANLYSGPQTWDSIVSGNALYTMSCSDKVCRWNVLGIQGALLYNFVGSVFYSSITLGSLHHPVHFKRAVYGRIEPLESKLEIPFHVHKPKLMMVSREEKRRVKKSPNHAVCWSIDWSTPEILAANKGRCEGGVASRLTKRMAFNRFLKLYENASGRREHYVDMTYHEAKCIAEDYQKAKKEFVNFFQESKLGPWIGKPLEQDSFKIK